MNRVESKAIRLYYTWNWERCQQPILVHHFLPPSISHSTKDTEKWITEVQALHANQPYPVVAHNQLSPDIDALMTEWPSKMEQILNTVGFPSAQLDCSLKFYIETMCALLDIPLVSTNGQFDYLIALNTLFNLYLAVKNPID